MNIGERHAREANIGAHLAWAAAFSASADHAADGGNVLAAAISYYYSVFHAGFALMNTDASRNFQDFSRIHHNQVESFLLDRLEFGLRQKVSNLRVTREFLNYLGAGEALAKLRIVRGQRFDTGLGTSNVDALVEIAQRESKEVFGRIYDLIEQHCRKHEWQPLWAGREVFVTEYLDDDAFLNVIPLRAAGGDIRAAAVRVLMNGP
jgi:hypothetical protein